MKFHAFFGKQSLYYWLGSKKILDSVYLIRTKLSSSRFAWKVRWISMHEGVMTPILGGPWIGCDAAGFVTLAFCSWRILLCCLSSIWCAVLFLQDFRKGMAVYLKRHQYKSARTEDLWAALEEASGKQVGRMMTTWTKQKGYPVLQVCLKEITAQLFSFACTV